MTISYEWKRIISKELKVKSSGKKPSSTSKHNTFIKASSLFQAKLYAPATILEESDPLDIPATFTPVDNQTAHITQNNLPNKMTIPTPPPPINSPAQRNY
jgi:hypothetical protein